MECKWLAFCRFIGPWVKEKSFSVFNSSLTLFYDNALEIFTYIMFFLWHFQLPCFSFGSLEIKFETSSWGIPCCSRCTKCKRLSVLSIFATESYCYIRNLLDLKKLITVGLSCAESFPASSVTYGAHTVVRCSKHFAGYEYISYSLRQGVFGGSLASGVFFFWNFNLFFFFSFHRETDQVPTPSSPTDRLFQSGIVWGLCTKMS